MEGFSLLGDLLPPTHAWGLSRWLLSDICSLLKMLWSFPGDPVAKDSCAPQGRRPSSILDLGTRSHMLQLTILHAATKTEDPACHN